MEYEDDILIVQYNDHANPNKHIVNKVYENNNYIDWYTETMTITKSSIFTTKIQFTIVLTAIIAGYIVTFIDLSSVWLNDLRKGICFSKINKWSLLNPYLTCPVDEWNNWSEILFDLSTFITSTFVNYPIYTILGLIFTVLSVFISESDKFIRQSGIPEIKEIIQGLNYNLYDFLGLKTLLFKITGLVLVVSSGFWLGKEGPLVHITCCLINFIYSILFGNNTNEAVRRELLSAATAIGISLAFNSPIGGVLFVLELIPSYFVPTKIMWNSFQGATVGLIVLVGFRLFTEGGDFNEQDLFSIEFGNFSWLIMEVIPFIWLGILGGIFGHLFIKLNSKLMANNFRAKLRTKLCDVFHVNISKANYLEILIIFLITSALNYPLTITRLSLSAFLKLLFKKCPENDVDYDNNATNFMCSTSDLNTLWKLLYISLQGFVLSVYSFGTILPGGVLMPSLVLGATCGRFVGIISRLLQIHLFGSLDTCTSNSCLVSPASYAVIGAGAFFTGITKLTMCVVVILFELTGAVSYVLPIMIGVMVLKFMSDYLCSENIYDAWLKYNFNTPGYSNDTGYNEGKGNGLCNYSLKTSALKAKLPDIAVSNVMVPFQNTKCICLKPSSPYSISGLYQFLNDDNHEGYPVITTEETPEYLGYIHKQKIFDLLHGMSNDTIVSFHVTDDPKHQPWNQQPESTNIVQLELTPEKSFIIMNEKTPLRILVDIFEKMYLNYLVINDSTQVPNIMVGFIDRFILARLIDNGFEGLHIFDTSFPQFDVEADDYEATDDLIMTNRDHSSIELIT